jgi:hypothetical protein
VSIEQLNEDAQFLMSVRGETPRDVWRAEWAKCQAARQAYFIAAEQAKSNPDVSLRQTIELDVIDNRVKVD